MNSTKAGASGPIVLPPARLCVGITGHRAGNASLRANRDGVRAELSRIFDAIDAAGARQSPAAAAAPRLHSLLAHGADLAAVELAFDRGWEVSAPLPFGLDVNVAINAHPDDPEDAEALIAGRAASDRGVNARADKIREIAARARRFELADQDEAVSALFLEMLRKPGDQAALHHFSTLTSERAAAAGRVMVEQIDLLIAVWDGESPGALGGTRHTIATALDHGAPVLWIDASAPRRLKLLRGPEALAASEATVHAEPAHIEELVESLFDRLGTGEDEKAIRFHTEHWRARSLRRFHAYRRIEAMFGGRKRGFPFGSLVQTYEPPEAIAQGSAAPLLAKARALPDGDERFVDRFESEVLRRFAWADGLSTYLSDAYRGGMVTNFLLSALAIIGGVIYLPFAGPEWKWPFALFEFVTLCAILLITATGRKCRWHGRWFETRRVAEYLRHAPILLMLGVARSPGRWPRGSETVWPETYARRVLREIGLPEIAVTQAYLRGAVDGLLRDHAVRQRDYHRDKAKRLTAVHHNLDRMSEALFKLAIVAVATYLLLVAGGALGLFPRTVAEGASKTLTFFGVAFPALGSAIAGIRYFGDFERFAAISQVTAEKLTGIEGRIEHLLAAPEGELRYAQVANLGHSLDEVVFAEIENWQAVFGAKQISVPV